jgi:hypothetical protein
MASRVLSAAPAHNIDVLVNRMSLVKVKLKLSLCLNKHYAMKAYGGVDV